MKKFKLQLIGSLGIIIVAIISILVTLSYYSFKSESISLNKYVLENKNKTIEAGLTEKFQAYKEVISALDITDTDVKNNELSAAAKNQLKVISNAQHKVTDGIYLFRENGDIYDAQGNLLDFNVKSLNREYYNAIFKKGVDFYVSAPFISAVSKEEVLGMAHKINNSFAVLSNIKLKAVLGSLAQSKNLFLYTDKGTLLISPYPDLIGKNVFSERPIYKQFSPDNPTITYSVDLNGQSVGATAFWSKLPVSGWSFVTFVRNSAIEEGASSQLNQSILIAIISLAIAITILLVLIQKLVLTPVGGAPEDIETFVASIAQGKLNQNIKQSGQETGIYKSLINLSNQLSGLIRTSHNISENVASASQELSLVMNDTLSNAQQEMSQVEQIATAINELSYTSKEMSDKAINAEKSATNMQQHINKGKEKLKENITLSDNINSSVAETAQLVQELQDFALEIGSVTDVINGISEQTNLLALNAAIEAARAGEHGRGFAVVADEVRSLASKTQQSTVNIQELIERLQSQSQKANGNMNGNVELIRESVELADQITESFEEISRAVGSISEINALVATSSREQQSVTEETSNNTTQAFALVQQNVEAVNQALQASTELAKLSEQQKEELSYFKV